MATKSSVAKQKRREYMVGLKWDKRQALKKIISSPSTTFEDRLAAVDKLN